MHIYMFAKYAYQTGQEYEIVGALLLYLISMSILITLSKRIWNWIREFNYTKQASEIEPPSVNPAKIYNQDECPICMSQPYKQLKTNCGHIFCGLCYRLFFIKTQAGPNRYKCPLCRCTVFTLQTCSKVEENDRTVEDYKISKFLDEYHQQFSRHNNKICTRRITPWIINIVVVIFLILTVMSPFLVGALKRIYNDFYILSQNIYYIDPVGNSNEFYEPFSQ